MPGRTATIERASKRTSVSRIGLRREVVIPKDVFDRLGLRKGDLVEVTAHAGRVSLKPKKSVGADDVLTGSDAKKVRHAMKQAQEGTTKAWADLKHELDL